MDQRFRSEGMDLQRPFLTAASLDDDEEGRKDEHDAQQKDQDAAAGQESELSHPPKVGRQKRVESRGGGERADHDSGQRVMHDRLDGIEQRLAAIPLVDETLIENGHEIDTEPGQESGEP